MDRMIGKRIVPDLETCPYNPAHRVATGHRFQRHLIECAKDHPDVEEVICKFNHTHRVKAPEAAHHMKNCPDRFIVERELIQMNSRSDMKFRDKLPNTEEVILPPSTECWDDELLAEPVSIPSIQNSNNKGIRFINADNLSGLKPAQKKKFRQNLWKGKTSWQDDDEYSVPQENGHSQQNDFPPKSLRMPSREPKAAQLEPMLEKLHLGRGMRRPDPTGPHPRIAANIFQRSEPMAQQQAVQYGLAGIGRGIPLTMSKAATISNIPTMPVAIVAPAAVPVMVPPSAACLPPPPPGLFSAIPLTQPYLVTPAEMVIEKPVDVVAPRQSPPAVDVSAGPAPQIPSTTTTNASSSSPTNLDSEALKWKKKLEKKLKQVERLEERLAAGETLNDEELGKINLKDALLEELGLKLEDDDDDNLD